MISTMIEKHQRDNNKLQKDKEKIDANYKGRT